MFHLTMHLTNTHKNIDLEYKSLHEAENDFNLFEGLPSIKNLKLTQDVVLKESPNKL